MDTEQIVNALKASGSIARLQFLKATPEDLRVGRDRDGRAAAVDEPHGI